MFCIDGFKLGQDLADLNKDQKKRENALTDLNKDQIKKENALPKYMLPVKIKPINPNIKMIQAIKSPASMAVPTLPKPGDIKVPPTAMEQGFQEGIG